MAPSIPQLLIVLAIVILIFGGRKITNLMTDMGHGLVGFKKAMKEAEELDHIADKKRVKDDDEQLAANTATER